MIRTPLILVASFGLLAGCATSSASTASNNPDAGKVDYDAGSPSGGGGSGSSGGTGSGTGSAPTTKGVDSTSTNAPGIGPKVVKKIASAKPPKPVEPTEPTDPKKPAPKRKGRVEVNGLLAEGFAGAAGDNKVPAFAGAAKTLFIVPSLDANTRFPDTLKAPFALRFTGSLNVLEAAEYKLCLNSSDGSKLVLEGTVAVDNDGVHEAPVEKCEVYNLEPGEYAIEVQSFHVAGTPTVQLLWAKGKDGTAAPIPKGNLFKPTDADARVKAQK
jgi:hypothetical protein